MQIIRAAISALILPAVLSCSPGNLLLAVLHQPFPQQTTPYPQPLSIANGGEIGGAFHSYLLVVKDASLSEYRGLRPIRIVGSKLQSNGTLGESGTWTVLVRSSDDSSCWSGEVTATSTKIQNAPPPSGYGSVSPSPFFDNYFIISSKWQYDSTAIPNIVGMDGAMTLMSPHEFEQLYTKAFTDPVWAVSLNGTQRYFNANTGAELPSGTPGN